MELTRNILERFWEKVNVPEKYQLDCWEWEAAKTSFGHGRFSIRGKLESPHRISYFLFFGEDPGDLYVCHKCDNPTCINPYHLFLGTQSDNMKDAVQKKRCLPPDLRIQDIGDCAWCSGCHKHVSRKSFHVDNSRHNGVQTYCKKCRKENTF